MSKVTVTESYLESIGDAIRNKLNTSQGYTPGQMAAAIESIPTGITPTGIKNITQNGQTDVTQYATADVNVPNSYAAGDEGKVVQNGALVAQTSETVTQNGTYDTTTKDEVVVDVSGGGTPNLQNKTLTQNGVYTADAGYDGLGTVTVNVSGGGVNVPQATKDFAQYINKNVILELNPASSEITIDPLEYIGNVYGNTSMINSLGLVLLGDFSQGGESSGNALMDSVSNYSGVVLQGIYQKQRTSNYNTSMYYGSPELNASYWAGMKDRNSSYTCDVTFTDSLHVSLTGNKQVIIYGMP